MTSTTHATDWLISVDDHLIETPTVWTDRLPAKYRDAGPRWVSDEHGDSWLFENSKRIPVDSNGTAGAVWPPDQRALAFTPLNWDEVEPACYDPKARIAAMETDHELAAVLFPNMAGFAGSLFQRAQDKHLALLCIQAYNDWLLDEWCNPYPGRFIGVGLVPLWDGELAAQEAERVLARGARAISFSQAPEKVGFPSITDKHWDPLFSLMHEAGLPLCMHLGTGIAAAQEDSAADMTKKMRDAIKNNDLKNLAERLGIDPAEMSRRRKMSPGTSTSLLGARMGQDTLNEWLASDNFERFPNLRMALSENGVGWIPSVLSYADWTETLNRMVEPKDTPLPSEIFHKHMYGCFIDEPINQKLVDELGADNIMVETDFPHTATNWPQTFDRLNERMAGLSEETRYKILRGNAERVFNFVAAEPPVPAK